jgi:hypothetical protein
MAQFKVLSRNFSGGIEASHRIIIISGRMVSLRNEIRTAHLPDMEPDLSMVTFGSALNNLLHVIHASGKTMSATVQLNVTPAALASLRV